MALSKATYQQTQKYPAWMDREAVYLGQQAGVYDASGAGTDFKVTAQSPAAMAVNIAIGRALIAQKALPPVGERAGFWGTYSDSVASRSIGANSSGNPRIDQAILYQGDSSTGSAGDLADIVIVPGTPAVGASLDTRTGAVSDATLTTTYRNWLRLADLQVDNGATSIGALKIRDRRTWALGALWSRTRNANAGGTNDYTWTGAGFVSLDSANLQPRIEATGRPFLISVRGSLHIATAGQTVDFAPGIDSVADTTRKRRFDAVNAGYNLPINIAWTITPAPGSHLLGPMVAVTSGATARLLAQAGFDTEVVIRENMRQNASND